MKTSKITVLAVVLILCLALFSCGKDKENGNEGAIFGIVTDSYTAEPIQSALVTLSPSNVNTLTDNDGHFEFNNLEACQYVVTVQKTGYATNRELVTTILGDVVNLSLTMRKNK